MSDFQAQFVRLARRRLIGAMAGAVALALLGALPGPAAAQPTLDALHKAAKAAGESEVVMYGPPSATLRGLLSKAWSDRFPDIALSYSPMTGGQIGSKIQSERRADVHAVDVIMTGPNTGARMLRPFGYTQSLDPLIVLPEVRDGKNWLDGELAWANEGKYALAMLILVNPATVINTDLVKPDEMTGDADLLNPKWAGKIIANDPRVPGSAGSVFRRLYELHGEDYIRKLIVDQKVVFIRDLRQAVDQLAKGKYAIGVGLSPSVLTAFADAGVTNLGTDHNLAWKGGLRSASAGFGGLMAPDRMPHPNAAKLFINWVLTRDGQAVLAKALEYPSRRVDVKVEGLSKYISGRPGEKYLPSYTDDFDGHPNQAKMIALLKALIK